MREVGVNIASKKYVVSTTDAVARNLESDILTSYGFTDTDGVFLIKCLLQDLFVGTKLFIFVNVISFSFSFSCEGNGMVCCSEVSLSSY